MYFSDEIMLVKETRGKNELNQYQKKLTETSVFANLKSVSSREIADAGTAGHKAEGIAEVHSEDYNGEELVKIIEPNKILKKGVYEIYRKYEKTDTVELYFKEKVGL